MLRSFTSFFVFFILTYGLINLWIGLRGWQFLGRFFPRAGRKIYWPVFWLLALGFPAGRFGREVLPDKVSLLLTLAGSYWMGLVIYLIMALAVVELAILLNRLPGFPSPGLSRHPRAPMAAGLAVLLAAGGVFLYGWWNARNPQITRYSIDIPKQAGQLKDLRVVAVSDLHLGIIVHNGRLLKLVEMINGLGPDLVVLPGDLVDESPGPLVEQDMISTFRQIAPKYGVYAVTGNHDYMSRKSEEIVRLLEGAGIKVLRDQRVSIDGSFYLVGRDDSSRRRTGGIRAETADLVNGPGPPLPVILLDHQPTRRGQAPEEGVDLKLSGHTHHGQLFPFNLITRRMYETDWGYLRQGSWQAVVSSGFGTWGPPIRVGSRPEVVLLEIHFF